MCTGSFGRRASDGGANLQIYYTTTNVNGQPVENVYSHPNSRECLRVDELQNARTNVAGTLDSATDESSDEIQR